MTAADVIRIGVPVRLADPDSDSLTRVVQDLFDAIVATLEGAGAVPVPLGPDLDGIAACRGFVVPGGGDVDPSRYGGAVDQPTLWGVDPAQDELDTAVLRFALERGRPVLGICRGMQLLNVALGGTLHTDLAESSVVHHLPPEQEFDLVVHPAALVDGSRCAAAYGSAASIPVPSGHHQAVDRLGAGLRVAALAEDGLVEAVEGDEQGAWTVGVQWHPESLPMDDALRLPLFRSLVEAAGRVELEAAVSEAG